MIGDVIAAFRREGGSRMRSAIAGEDRLSLAELASNDDPGLFGPDSVVWQVHGESSMLIGGLRALLLQTLHPLTMAGVADHSDYKSDPWGRLHRTGRFVGATTYGTVDAAEQMIDVVRTIHDRVTGFAPDGRPYAANDPHLLAWVHVTEVDSFLRAYDRYGSGRLTDAERDRYVAEMSEVGHRLGAEPLPQTKAELAESLRGFRRECRFGEQAAEAVQFLLFPPVALPLRPAYALIGAAAVSLLPRWARWELMLPLPPLAEPIAIRPAATALTRGIGWLLDDDPTSPRNNLPDRPK
jgi:uncharacterized protein (DUF2236 family)